MPLVVTEHDRPFIDLPIVRQQNTSLANRKRLFGHQRKRRDVAESANELAFVKRAVGVGGILDDLNLVPFGAYVKMLGEEDPTAPGSFASQPKRIRAAVLIAGSAMNFLVAVTALIA